MTSTCTLCVISHPTTASCHYFNLDQDKFELAGGDDGEPLSAGTSVFLLNEEARLFDAMGVPVLSGANITLSRATCPLGINAIHLLFLPISSNTNALSKSSLTYNEPLSVSSNQALSLSPSVTGQSIHDPIDQGYNIKNRQSCCNYRSW